jgi:energy-converting hydrogenase Eha subunit H
MKLPITLLSVAAAFIAISCGLSQNQKTALLDAQKAKDDSIRIAAIGQVKKTEALKSSLGDSINFYVELLNRQQNSLILNKTAVFTANDEMTQIQAFHLGRTPQQRDQQVRDQELKIQTLVSQQPSLQTAIQQITYKIYNFKSQLTALKD